MQHQAADQMEGFLQNAEKIFYDKTMIGQKVDEYVDKHTIPQNDTYENRKKIDYIYQWGPQIRAYYNEFAEKFPHAEGIDNVIQTACDYYRIQNPEDRNAFIFNEVVNQNVKVKQAVQKYNNDKQKLHTMSEYQDEKMRRKKIPPPAPQKLNRNVPSSIVDSIQTENSRNIDEVARDRQLPELIFNEPVVDVFLSSGCIS
jgi:hypothetical protein